MKCIQDYTNESRQRIKIARYLLRITLIAAFAILFLSGSAMAISGYLSSFNSLYTGSSSGTNASCNLCHSSGGGTDLNPFGEAFAMQPHSTSALRITAFQNIQNANSDNDPTGANNKAEIDASAQPGWTPGPNNTLYDITAPGTGTVVATNQLPPNIVNLDPASAPPTLPTVTIAATSPNASEAGPTNGQFTVTRTGSTTSLLAVNYTISGTATNGTDYSTLSGSVTIAAGSATATITVTPLLDALTEGTETVILTLSANAAYTVGSPSSATVNIADASPPPTLPAVTIAATSPNASETGPTAGIFTVSRAGSTTAALVVNYTISGTATNGTDYLTLPGNVSIASGSSTATITVTPIDDALIEGSETVILTLSANAAYTIGSPSSATVTIADNDSASPPPPSSPTGPMIALDVAKVDFGQVQINTTGTRTASVHNIGDAELNVTGITRCQSTSNEYSWSPDMFTVAPGASQTLTVFYKPLDQTSDTGCVQIASNDSTQNPEILNVAGSGVVAVSGAPLDVDIVRFTVDKKIDLMRLKPIKIQLLVKQVISGQGTAQATITGTQNNVEIYSETLPITIQASSNTSNRQRGGKATQTLTLTFPSYTPVAEGNIVWTATVSDPDPDFDEATATTKIVLGKGKRDDHGDKGGDNEND